MLLLSSCYDWRLYVLSYLRILPRHDYRQHHHFHTSMKIRIVVIVISGSHIFIIGSVIISEVVSEKQTSIVNNVLQLNFCGCDQCWKMLVVKLVFTHHLLLDQFLVVMNIGHV